jgi:hypothetical protein
MAWRDFLRVHPAAELFPMMAPAEIKDLADDIKVQGLRHAIVLWRDADGEYSLLDGRNRLDAWEAAGLNVPEGAEAILRTMNATLLDATEKIDPYDYVVSINLHRRHLTGEQKRDVIAILIKLKPEMSDRQIAKMVGASPTTAGDVRRELVKADQLSNLDSRVGADGKTRKLPPPKPAAPLASSMPTVLRGVSRDIDPLFRRWILQVPRAVENIDMVAGIKTVVALAAAISAYYRSIRNTDAAREARHADLHARRRGGQLLIAMERDGARVAHQARKGTQIGIQPGVPTLKELGISKKDSGKWQAIGRLSDAQFQALLNKAARPPRHAKKITRPPAPLPPQPVLRRRAF